MYYISSPSHSDDFSLDSLFNVAQLLYGMVAPGTYTWNTFQKDARECGVELPTLRLVVANRFQLKAGDKNPNLFANIMDRLKSNLKLILLDFRSAINLLWVFFLLRC